MWGFNIINSGFLIRCVDTPLDEAIGAFIASKPDLHWLWTSLLKGLGKAPGWIVGRVKHFRNLLKCIKDEVTANKIKFKSLSKDSEPRLFDQQQIQALVEIFKKYTETK